MIVWSRWDVREFSTQVKDGHYFLPLSVAPLPDRVVVGLEQGLLFRLLDLLLGGSGEVLDPKREITEIDEELFRSVMEVVCVPLERTWKSREVSVALLPSINRRCWTSCLRLKSGCWCCALYCNLASMRRAS